MTSETSSNISPHHHVVIVGGGVIGAACAYYLARDGRQVTIVDRNEFGRGCSHGNCGFISPSHVLPLTSPGAIGMALRSLFKPTAPFRIKPRLDPTLWWWLLQFARRCNTSQMLRAAGPIHELLHTSRRLYDQLFASEPFHCDWETRGLLFVFQSLAGLQHHAETATLLREQFGLAIDRYDGASVNELEPTLKPGLAGGFLYPDDAHLRPDKLMSSWRRILLEKGVTLRENCVVQRLVQDQDRTVALSTTQGDIPADAFVIAAGAWTPQLNRELGCQIPIQPGKGYSITLSRPARCPTYPLMFEEHRVAVTPFQAGYRLGSTMEFAGYDATLDRRRLDYLREGASHYLLESPAQAVEEEWCGWRPMTYDSLPIIDRSPHSRNVWIAAGHNMLGVSMSPATGQMIAEMIDGKPTSLNAEPYSLRRF
ncbi:MAG: dadA [Planctomycetaceae bacterium]|nr:dadA [Planctomycetaceae bacterium]